MLLKALTRKLRPLDMVMQIVDGERIKNAEQLQRYLLTRAAATIPSYWFQLMRPEVTEEAAVFCKGQGASSRRSARGRNDLGFICSGSGRQRSGEVRGGSLGGP